MAAVLTAVACGPSSARCPNAVDTLDLCKEVVPADYGLGLPGISLEELTDTRRRVQAALAVDADPEVTHE